MNNLPVHSIFKKYISPFGITAGTHAKKAREPKEDEKLKARPVLESDTFQKHASGKTLPHHLKPVNEHVYVRLSWMI